MGVNVSKLCIIAVALVHVGHVFNSLSKAFKKKNRLGFEAEYFL